MKKVICVFIALIFAMVNSQCMAGDGAQHEEELEIIFLGRTLSDDSKDPKKYGNSPAVLFGYLEDAIYLCIDQMGNQGQPWLNELNDDFQVEGLPKSINEISVPVNNHERYTHLGWDYQFYPYKEKWMLRQNILLATVSKVFGFPIDKTKSGNERYSTDCIEMSKLIYYIHILGDHSHNTFATTTDRIQLRNTVVTRGEIEAGLINELRKCISKLFWNQRTSMKYNWLMVKLNVVRFRAWAIGEEDSEDKHIKIMDIAKSTLNYLTPQIRKMLLESWYFKNVFRDIVSQN